MKNNLKIKIIILSIVVLIAGLIAGFMIGDIHATHKIKKMIKQPSNLAFHRVMKAIDPTKEQLILLNPIIIKYKNEIDKFNIGFKSEIANLRDKFEEEIKPILTSVQKNKLNQFKIEHDNSERNQFIERPFEFLKVDLTLSKEQIEKIKPKLKTYRCKLKHLKMKQEYELNNMNDSLVNEILPQLNETQKKLVNDRRKAKNDDIVKK